MLRFVCVVCESHGVEKDEAVWVDGEQLGWQCGVCDEWTIHKLQEGVDE